MTFLFDIGRVLLDFDFETSLARLLPPGTADPQARLAVLLERKDEFETGAIAPDAYIAWALEVLGSGASHAEFRHAWCHIFTPNVPMWQTVRMLAAAGHRLILLSNTNALHCPWVFGFFPDFALFHAAVLSFEVGAVKPQPAIYQHAIATHRLDPATTLFIDDLAANIAAGLAHGLRCFQYDQANHAAFQQWLHDERVLVAAAQTGGRAPG
ncbi:MAG: HAD family phosphatase [Verrucomicrobia bacterium]|nr:HAD family phosphatase [Verrucomicrobiota bacterium]